MMGKKKVEEDTQQRKLFSCSNFKAQQAARSSQPVQTATKQQRDENKDANTTGASSLVSKPCLVAAPVAPQAGAELQHAATAMQRSTAQQSRAGPQDFDEAAVKKVADVRGELNAEQLQAALAPLSPPVFLLAGAGTGKTKTLIARVWHMLSQGIFPRAPSQAGLSDLRAYPFRAVCAFLQ